MNPESGAHRPARDIEGQRRGRDPERPGLRGAAGIGRKPMRAAEVVGRLELELDMTGGIRCRLGNHAGGFLPAEAGHAIAGERRPLERRGLAGRKSVAPLQRRCRHVDAATLVPTVMPTPTGRRHAVQAAQPVRVIANRADGIGGRTRGRFRGKTDVLRFVERPFVEKLGDPGWSANYKRYQGLALPNFCQRHLGPQRAIRHVTH
jgi:hypothetical protein